MLMKPYQEVQALKWMPVLSSLALLVMPIYYWFELRSTWLQAGSCLTFLDIQVQLAAPLPLGLKYSCPYENNSMLKEQLTFF